MISLKGKAGQLFWFGFCLKLTMVALFYPEIRLNLFAPFLERSLDLEHFFNPWGNEFIAANQVSPFPYGPFMYIALIPGVAISTLFDVFYPEVPWALISIGLTSLVFDLLLLLALLKITKGKQNLRVIFFYWTSPLTLYVIYWHGQLDIIPASILMWSYLLLIEDRFFSTGVALAIAVASKLSMLIALPFIVIYLFQRADGYKSLIRFLKGFAIIFLVGVVAPMFSKGYQSLVLGTPEFKKLFSLTINFSDTYFVYVLPLLYLVFVYAMWRLKRTNKELLIVVSGISFLGLVALMPLTPGWLLWVLPFIVIYACNADFFGRVLFVMYILSITSLMVISSQFSGAISTSVFDITLPVNIWADNSEPSMLINGILGSAVIFSGILIALRFYRDGVKNNLFAKITQERLVIYSNVIPQCVNSVKQMYQEILGSFVYRPILIDNYVVKGRDSYLHRGEDTKIDLRHLIDDVKSLRSRLHKDYADRLGLTKTQLSSVSIANFFDESKLMPRARREFDLSLDFKVFDNARSIDEIRLEECELTEFDAILFLESAEVLDRSGSGSHLDGAISIFLKDGSGIRDLLRILISYCGLQVDFRDKSDGMSVLVSISGEIWAEDIASAVKHLTPSLSELLIANPKWHSNTHGLVQLLITWLIDQSLAKK